MLVYLRINACFRCLLLARSRYSLRLRPSSSRDIVLDGRQAMHNAIRKRNGNQRCSKLIVYLLRTVNFKFKFYIYCCTGFSQRSGLNDAARSAMLLQNVVLKSVTVISRCYPPPCGLAQIRNSGQQRENCLIGRPDLKMPSLCFNYMQDFRKIKTAEKKSD